MNSPIRWHGGKSYLAKWIISHFPPHTRYVEPFFGGGSVLLAKDPENVAEFANDIYGHLSTFWRVLADPVEAEVFHRKLSHNPLSQLDFNLARQILAADMMAADGEKSSDQTIAMAFFIVNRMSRQGRGKDYCTPSKRLRRGMNENVSAWLSAVDGLPEIHERLRRVEVWNRDALDVITALDSPDTLFYLDPPYMHETRTTKDAYKHEMDDTGHRSLLMTLPLLEGKFVISGYPHPLYDEFASDFHWHVRDKEQPLHSSGKASKERKIERLWMNFDPGV